MKPRKKYTMSEAAIQQRKLARKNDIRHDWASVRIYRELYIWSRDTFGTANHALLALRQCIDDGKAKIVIKMANKLRKEA